MPTRTKPPFRAEHVGSLLRPPALKQARLGRAAGKIDAARLRAIEDDAIRAVVKRQEELGLQLVTDGELRRDSWHMDFYQQIGGLVARGAAPIRFKTASAEIDYVMPALHIEGKLSLPKTIFGEDFAFLKAATRVTPKLTIPSPSVLHRRAIAALDNPALYPSIEPFWTDLAAVYAQEIARLGALGCTYLQIDDTSFATLCDPAQRASLSKMGADGEHIHETYIRVFNAAVKDRPAGMTLVTHTCRGNHRSAWFAAGSYDFIAETLFNRLDVDGFFLEYDDERSGDFAPLRFLPKGKIAVLGLVSSKRRALESKDQIKRRLDEAAKYAPLEQLALSPQCGFSSTLDGNDLTEAEQFAKLSLVSEVAREVWGT
ncbi:MAG TPA: 5-methyltetrahydropteroyltriglutamate--homocysteine S-methyltransferase [Stellaceae bacterium]|nr:5-methyltetrahydropteroyltriglutamate--homocysteine S-methyltransferase [Stellaceae bacterium]